MDFLGDKREIWGQKHITFYLSLENTLVWWDLNRHNQILDYGGRCTQAGEVGVFPQTCSGPGDMGAGLNNCQYMVVHENIHLGAPGSVPQVVVPYLTQKWTNFWVSGE